MKLRYKFAIAAFVLVIGATTALALTISYDAPCESAALAEPREPAMRAVIYRCYGSPEVLERVEIAKPAPWRPSTARSPGSKRAMPCSAMQLARLPIT